MSGSESDSALLFPVSRWRMGYDRAEVDAFVRRLRTGPSGGISASQVRYKQFSPARLARAGYDVVVVDAYLEAVAGYVEGGGSPDGIPVPGPGR